MMLMLRNRFGHRVLRLEVNCTHFVEESLSKKKGILINAPPSQNASPRGASIRDLTVYAKRDENALSFLNNPGRIGITE